jgi:vacuolar iron transporter family protein
LNPVESWAEEKRSAYLYGIVAEAEAGTPRQTLFNELACRAESQAGIWAGAAQRAGLILPGAYVPEVRTRIVAWLVRRLGARPLRSVLAAMKLRGMSLYTKNIPGHSMPATVSDVGRRHKGVTTGGNLRAAVFGVNDGLISNASLIMGVAGASSDVHVVLLSGIAGLAAGAISMGAGEYVSVRSQREMHEYQIGLEREELGLYPQEEAAELALIYEARGLPKNEADRLAARMIENPELGLDTLTREELGLNPEELGSPWSAAISSFCSFAAGGLIPLVPYFFPAGAASLLAAGALTLLALFAVGATLSLFTGRRAAAGGLRMMLIGGAAGGFTYLLGKLLGVSLA